MSFYPMTVLGMGWDGLSHYKKPRSCRLRL